MARGRHPLIAGEARLVTAARDQLTLRRMGATLAAAGMGQPVRYLGADETAAGTGAGRVVVALGCDVSDPVCMAGLRRLRKAAKYARIVVVTPATDVVGVRRALDGGADGVVFESELEASLAASMVAVAAEQTVVPRRLRAALHRPAFSHRERQTLAHAAAGLTNKEIADALFLSESTVKSHLSSAFAKLGVRSRREAVALMLDPDQRFGRDVLAARVPALRGDGTVGES